VFVLDNELQWKTDRKSRVACQMVPFPVTLSDVEVTIAV